jgi:hypothetical protein
MPTTRQTTTEAWMSNDPWLNLATPTSSSAASALRVDASIPWNLFWARDTDGRCLLLLRHAADVSPVGDMARFKGLEVVTRKDGASTSILYLRLLDSKSQDLFEGLCRDIVECVREAATEADAVQALIRQTWRWHRLLSGGGSDRLSREEQQGLIGELLFLETHLLGHISAADAVRAWRGPLGAPKDFELGTCCVEVKARRGGAIPAVRISTEHQLDDSGLAALFLSVRSIQLAPADAEHAASLTEVVEQVQHRINTEDGKAEQRFEELLLAVGYRSEDDYAAEKWTVGAEKVFRVKEGFPRITSTTGGPGVSKVHYEVSLPECAPFQLSVETFTAELEAFTHGK